MAEPKILYEDEDLKVIDKPVGMTINRVPGGPLFAHRLDKETSGCLLVAKSETVLLMLMDMFRRREVHKEYVAVVHGLMQPKEGSVRLPIGRVRGDGKKRGIKLMGKEAETRWRVENYVDGMSVVRLWPKTGRTHQLRVHLAHLGHPIVGDSLYLNQRQKTEDRGKWKRHLLHAEVLELIHPVTKRPLKVVSPLPFDFAQGKPTF